MSKTSIRISAPPEKVFSYIADFTGHADWASHKLAIEPLQGGEPQVGSRYLSTGEQFGREVRENLTVLAYEPNRLLIFESEGSSGAWQHSFEIQPGEQGCVLTRTMMPVKLPFLVRLLSPLFDLGLRRRNNSDLSRLKQEIESR